MWPALRTYFVSQGEEDCPAILWKWFKEEESEPVEHSLAKMYLSFVHNFMCLFQEKALLLQRNECSSPELHSLISGLQEQLQRRLEENFFGSNFIRATSDHSVSSHIKTRLQKEFRNV